MLILFLILSPFISQDPTEELLDDGYELYASGLYGEALKIFDRAADLSPDNPEVHLFRGLCLHSMEEVEKSIRAMEKAVELDPDYLDAWQEMGYIYLVGQAPTDAIRAYNQAIRLDPTNATLFVNRGTAKCMLEDKEGAMEDWLKAKSMGADFSSMMICD